MIIRKATILDVSAIYYMLTIMHKETEIKVSDINSSKLLDKLNQLVHQGIIIVAEKDKQLCGSIGGQVSQDWWSDEKYVSDAWFYVYKNHRKSTIAKKLLQYFINVIKEAKMNLRLGHVFSGDIDRKDKFYERMGFVKAGSIYVEK